MLTKSNWLKNTIGILKCIFVSLMCLWLLTSRKAAFSVTRERTEPWPMLYLWYQEHCGWCLLPPYRSLDRGNRTHWWNETHNQLLLPRCWSESHAFLQVTKDNSNHYAVIFIFVQYIYLCISMIYIYIGRQRPPLPQSSFFMWLNNFSRFDNKRQEKQTNKQKINRTFASHFIICLFFTYQTMMWCWSYFIQECCSTQGIMYKGHHRKILRLLDLNC